LSKIINKVKRILRGAGYKLTRQREMILKVLLKNNDRHLSADDVYNLVKEEAPDIGLSTVYRTLDLFSECNILHGINFGDGRKRYEFRMQEGNSEHHHHHLICLGCGAIIEVKEDLLEDIEKNIERDNNFKITDHQLKFFGYCEECMNKKEGD